MAQNFHVDLDGIVSGSSCTASSRSTAAAPITSLSCSNVGINAAGSFASSAVLSLTVIIPIVASLLMFEPQYAQGPISPGRRLDVRPRTNDTIELLSRRARNRALRIPDG